MDFLFWVVVLPIAIVTATLFQDRESYRLSLLSHIITIAPDSLPDTILKADIRSTNDLNDTRVVHLKTVDPSNNY